MKEILGKVETAVWLTFVARGKWRGWDHKIMINNNIRIESVLAEEMMKIFHQNSLHLTGQCLRWCQSWLRNLLSPSQPILNLSTNFLWWRQHRRRTEWYGCFVCISCSVRYAFLPHSSTWNPVFSSPHLISSFCRKCSYRSETKYYQYLVPHTPKLR
jgi:hypothetical protein